MTGPRDETRPAASWQPDGSAPVDVFTSTGPLVAAPVADETPAGGRVGGRVVAGSVAASRPRWWPDSEPLDPAAIADTRAWLAREIAAGQQAAAVAAPTLGTAAWAALDDREPAKWVAVFRAARGWLNDYVATPQTIARQAAEERERWKAIIAERDHADLARFRAFCLDAAAGIDRRERQQRARRDAAARASTLTGPELIARARASFAHLDGPADPAPAESVPSVPAVPPQVNDTPGGTHPAAGTDRSVPPTQTVPPHTALTSTGTVGTDGTDSRQATRGPAEVA